MKPLQNKSVPPCQCHVCGLRRKRGRPNVWGSLFIRITPLADRHLTTSRSLKIHFNFYAAHARCNIHRGVVGLVIGSHHLDAVRAGAYILPR